MTLDEATTSGNCPYFRHQYPDGHLGWFVTDYRLSKELLYDPRFSGRPLRSLGDDGGFQEAMSGPECAGDLSRNDPPQHTHLRRAQTRYFTVKRVGEQRAKIEGVVDLCLDAMEVHGPPLDFVEMFAEPVPSIVLCDLLGVPREDRAKFVEPTAILTVGTRTTPEEKKVAIQSFYAYIRAVIERKRAHPGDDLLSDLVARGALNDDELAGTMLFLFAAGHGTVLINLALSVFFLLSDLGRWDAARADLSSVERTVEELLRLLSPVPTMTRTATENIELQDGTVIQAGEAVTVWGIAPSGDPAEIGDPNHFDPSREPVGHLAFASGRHMCLGQHLARLEMQVALERLMRRFPNLRLAVPAADVPLQPVEVLGAIEIPGQPTPSTVERLPVAW
jgi:cytochrome P450